jgi:hypothetical protein
MIGYLSGPWMILAQTKMVEGAEVEVACKAIRYFPREKPDGTLEFVPMKYWSYQVLVGHVRSNEILKVKLTMQGTRKTGWRVQFPDRTVQTDPWNPQAVTLVKVDPFTTVSDDQIDDYLVSRFGRDMANVILTLLLETKAEDEQEKVKTKVA